MDWPRLLAYITGTVDHELLLRNEYLVAENRILKAQITGRLHLSDAERTTLAEIGHRLGRESLEDVAVSANPDTILGWADSLNKRDWMSGRSAGVPGSRSRDLDLMSITSPVSRKPGGKPDTLWLG
jgi:putative transposase